MNQPSWNAGRATWSAYAAEVGVDVEPGDSRNDIRARCATEAKPARKPRKKAAAKKAAPPKPATAVAGESGG